MAPLAPPPFPLLSPSYSRSGDDEGAFGDAEPIDAPHLLPAHGLGGKQLRVASPHGSPRAHRGKGVLRRRGTEMLDVAEDRPRKLSRV